MAGDSAPKPHLTSCFLGSPLVPTVTPWILQKQMLRWSLEAAWCFSGIFTCERKKGYEQDWTDGLAELWVSPNKALVNLVITQGMVLPIQGGLRWLGPFCLAQYIPDIRWGSARGPQILREPAAGDLLSALLKGSKPFPEVVWVTHRCVCQGTQWFCWSLLSFSCPKLHACSVPPILVLPTFTISFFFTQHI